MKKILVIEDEKAVQEVICQMLELSGFQVSLAKDGDEGIKLYREDPADLVITDLVMPGKEGIEVIKELNRDFPGVKIIAISGGLCGSPSGFLAMAEALGASRTISKPFQGKELVALVKELLDQS